MDGLNIEKTVRRALDEDLGRGDITTEITVPPETRAKGLLISKSDGILAGIEFARVAFLIVDARIEFEAQASDGCALAPGAVIARVQGRARSILTAERVALNFLQRLSGIATVTAAAVETARPSGVGIVDTRKTAPGLRLAEKYAVRAGGGKNHRMGLDDAVLIKDNHLEMAGGVKRAVGLARQTAGPLLKIEVEVETQEQVQEAVDSGADVIMLDNMSLAEMKDAVEMIAGRAVVEASGGIRPEMIGEIAATGVDFISLGWITHSAKPLDISLELKKI